MTVTTDRRPAAPDVPEDRPAARRRRTPTPRQLEDSARNRADIVRAALQVFAERGFAATTLEAVAKLVGLTRQGVLYHFSSKDALFAAVIEDQERWARDRFGGPAPAPTDEPRVVHRLRVLVPFLGRDDSVRIRLQMVQVLQGEAMSGNPVAVAFAVHRLENVRRQIGAILEDAAEAGELRAGIDVSAMAVLVLAGINGLQAQWLLDESVDTAAAFEELLTFVTPV